MIYRDETISLLLHTLQYIHPFPCVLCSFASFLADQGLAPQTGKSYLSALRSMQISLGLPDPREHSSMPVFKRVQAGISRMRLLKGTPGRIRLPITVLMLGKIKTALFDSSNPKKVVIWAVACTAFFGFFRLGELFSESRRAFVPATDLSWGDVAVDNHSSPRMIQIHLKKSKCDQVGGGCRGRHSSRRNQNRTLSGCGYPRIH